MRIKYKHCIPIITLLLLSVGITILRGEFGYEISPLWLALIEIAKAISFAYVFILSATEARKKDSQSSEYISVFIAGFFAYSFLEKAIIYFVDFAI